MGKLFQVIFVSINVYTKPLKAVAEESGTCRFVELCG